MQISLSRSHLVLEENTPKEDIPMNRKRLKAALATNLSLLINITIWAAIIYGVYVLLK
jgi:hypothetical protein